MILSPWPTDNTQNRSTKKKKQEVKGKQETRGRRSTHLSITQIRIVPIWQTTSRQTRPRWASSAKKIVIRVADDSGFGEVHFPWDFFFSCNCPLAPELLSFGHSSVYRVGVEYERANASQGSKMEHGNLRRVLVCEGATYRGGNISASLCFDIKVRKIIVFRHFFSLSRSCSPLSSVWRRVQKKRSGERERRGINVSTEDLRPN